MMTIDMNQRGFAEIGGRIIAITGQTSVEWLKQWMGTAIRYAMALTPPFSKSGRLASWKSGAKSHFLVGERAVERDISRKFPPFSKIIATADIDRRAKRWFSFYAKRRDVGKINKMLRDFKSSVEVIEAVNTGLHKSFFKTRYDQLKGRLTGKPLYVLNAKTTKALLKEKLSHIGRAKWGWGRAALGMALKRLPAWVTRHTVQPGDFFSNLTGERPSMTAINSALGAVSDEGASQMQAVYNELVKAANFDLQRLMQKRIDGKLHGKTIRAR